MRMKTSKWWALGVAMALTVVTGSGAAVLAQNDDDEDDDQEQETRLVQSGEILPLEPLLEPVLAERQGTKLKAELEHERGQYVYEVKLLDNKGVVWKMEFDAKTGALLRTKQDD
jgi:uncharacterized membrane protein YkoI